MNIKDFRPGQEVFGLTERYGWNRPLSYGGFWLPASAENMLRQRRKERPIQYRLRLSARRTNNLTEAKDWGDKEKLFASEQALQDYQERKELFWTIRRTLEPAHANQYSLEQLREIRKILDK